MSDVPETGTGFFGIGFAADFWYVCRWLYGRRADVSEHCAVLLFTRRRRHYLLSVPPTSERGGGGRPTVPGSSEIFRPTRVLFGSKQSGSRQDLKPRDPK